MNMRLPGYLGSMSSEEAMGTPLGQRERGIYKDRVGALISSELEAQMHGPRQGGTWEGQPQTVGVPHRLA